MSEVIVSYLKDDIELVKGGDWHETIYCLEDDGVTPKNITNWTMTMVIVKSPNGEEFDNLTTDGTRIVKTIASGQFNFNIMMAEIEAYDFSVADYKMAINYGDGNNQVWRKGTIKVV